jgi:hypothetical protein
MLLLHCLLLLLQGRLVHGLMLLLLLLVVQLLCSMLLQR